LGLGACEQAGQQAADKAKEAKEKGADATATAGDKAKEAKEKVADDTSAAAKATADTAKEAKDKVVETAADVKAAAVEKAKEMIQKVKDYLAKNDLDSADEIMGHLHKMWDSLPDEIRAQIDALKKKIAELRAGAAAPPAR
jgi:hypothetical protein